MVSVNCFIYWYFNSKAKTQDFNASVCIGLLSWLKIDLRGRTCDFIPSYFQNSKYPLYIIVLITIKALFY